MRRLPGPPFSFAAAFLLPACTFFADVGASDSGVGASDSGAGTAIDAASIADGNSADAAPWGVAILPHEGPDQWIDLQHDVTGWRMDVFLLTETSGVLEGTLANLVSSFSAFMTGLRTTLPGVAFGAGWYDDFPVAPFGESGDLPFALTARITTDPADAQAGLDAFVVGAGGDADSSGFEALYQAITGDGLASGIVPKFDPVIGFDPLKGHGMIGGAGYRADAIPVIVQVTEVGSHDGPDYASAGITDAHTGDEVVLAASALGARVVGVTSSMTVRAALEDLARDTGAVVSPTVWGPGETFCHTGAGGAARPPDPTGLCPLVFDREASGTGFDTALAAGIQGLSQDVAVDLSVVAIADPEELPALDTSLFVTGIHPYPPAPPGATIDGDVIRDVRPGATVRFAIYLRNTLVEEAAEAQTFRVGIRVMADGAHIVAEYELRVIVPAIAGP